MFKFDLGEEVVFKTYEGTQRHGMIRSRYADNKYMQPYYRITSGMSIYTDIMESMIEFETPRVDKPSNVVYDYRGHEDVLDLIKGMMGATVIVDQKDYCDSLIRDFCELHNIKLVECVDRSKAHIDKMVEMTKHRTIDTTKTSSGVQTFNDGFISGVRSGKSETHANSMFDKESRDRIMKLMGNKEIRVMEGTDNLFYKMYFEGGLNDYSPDAHMYGLARDMKPYVTSNYFHYKLEDTKPLALTPSKVFFNDKKKATTIMFGETATVVKCGKGDKYDRRIGFLEAYFQATCNMSKNKALKYLNEIVKDKEVKEEATQEKKVEENKNVG
jgi:hypothetical protein